MRKVLILALALALASATAARAEQPNIIVILADDLGYGDVHSCNPTRGKIHTPNIDRLAAQGVRFTDAHSSSAVCSPSRYTLLTGRYHWRTGQAGIVGQWGEPMIADGRLTLPGLLKAQGYRTAAIGKWHLGWTWPRTGKESFNWEAPIRNGPTTRGFDSYFGTDVPNWPPFCFIENDRTVGVPSERLAPRQVGNNLASHNGPALPGWDLDEILPALEKRAVAFLEQQTPGRPFFLYLPLTTPHTPLAVAPEWRGKSGLNTYADLVMQTDATVGHVLDALDRSGTASNTLVVFTSDNGCAPYVGAQELERKGHFPSGPLRGYKSDVWEGGHRIPFIVRWPGTVAPGTTCGQLVQQADLMATCAEITGAKVPENAAEDSFSILPLLRAEDRAVRPHAVNQSIEGLLALREGSWKLIFGPGSGGWSKGGGGQTAQLYDLSTDLGETNNLLASNPGRVADMSALMAKLVQDGRSTPGAAQRNDKPLKWAITVQ